MRRLVCITIVLVCSATAGALLTGSTWFLIDYAHHPAAIDDRGFFTVGPGFAGLLGANIGLVQGGLLGTLVAAFGLSRTAGAILGAALTGVTFLFMGIGDGVGWGVLAAVLNLVSGMTVGWGSAHLWKRLLYPRR